MRKSGKVVEAKQQRVERIFYCVECPECGEWHEKEELKFRGKIECICGADIKIIN